MSTIVSMSVCGVVVGFLGSDAHGPGFDTSALHFSGFLSG